MRLDDNIKAEIEKRIIKAHRQSQKAKIYLWEIRTQLFSITNDFTEPGFVEPREIVKGLNQVVASSKANNYSSKQFLKLLANMIEGFAKNYQKELLIRNQEKKNK